VNKLKNLNSSNNLSLHVVLAFVIATAIFVPISVYSEFMPGTILVEINGESYEIDYEQDGVDIQNIKANFDDIKLIFDIEVTNPGKIKIDFQRSFFDSKLDGKDEVFFVYVDELFYIIASEEGTTSELRRLMFEINPGTKKFEIFGSFLGVYTLEDPKAREEKYEAKAKARDEKNETEDSDVKDENEEEIMIDIVDVTNPESSQIPDIVDVTNPESSQIPDIVDVTNPESAQIPYWIRNNAKWWSEGSIGDSDFVSGIQYLMQQGVMKIPKTEQISGATSEIIPDWIKNNAGWWADGLISDDDFVNGIQYLVSDGIIRV